MNLSQPEDFPLYINETHPLLDQASAHEKYILLINNKLQLRNEKNVVKINELEAKNEKLEEEADRDDNSRNNLKNLLKNFHEIHKWNEELVKLYKTSHNKTTAHIQSYKQKAWFHLRILYTLLIITLGVSWELHTFPVFTELTALVTIISVFQYSTWRNLTLPKCSQQMARIQELSREKARTLKAQDYIYDFIDSQ